MPATSGFRPWLADHKWPLGYVAIIVFLFLLYQAILPNLIDEVSTPVTAWLPVATINECLMWAIMALGLNVVVGYAGLLDLGYVAFWALGGYTAGWLMAAPFNWTWDFQLFAPVAESYPGTHITFWLVILIAGCLCALLGVAIGAPTLRLRGDYLALVTLGFGEVITQFFRNSNDIDGYNVANGDAGIPIIDPIGLGPFSLIAGVPESLTNSGSDNIYKILVLGALLGLCLFISLRIRGGRLGRAWLAIREDQLAATTMGVPLVRSKLLAYAVGAFFGGIGGMGNVWGVTIGAFLLAWLNSNGLRQIGVTIGAASGRNLEAALPRYNFLILGLLLVFMMLFRREGLLPEKRTKALLTTPSRIEMESVGAHIAEAEAKNRAIAESNPNVDAEIAGSAGAVSPDLEPPAAAESTNALKDPDQ